ncbi:hypothetical protein SISNIDRAFT_454702 [Sistotremastrum niveocremeum HHB9708]|uniref:BAH domain-containing protein n=1 Tax=Sistotremastrum niveocremeum HHB9708 TaxID=1314777 RepID=A0A164USQ1_9AGAM|nr:hypothetical protein SISNIDRAFT_454702 [Sistotremastrum niveocremeum HHB9708]
MGPHRTARDSGIDHPPSLKEWTKMKRFKSYTVVALDEERFTFFLGDDVYILPEGQEAHNTPPERLWNAKIKEIRAKGFDSDDVWLQVIWYYSPTELSQRVSAFDPSFCGTNERIFSNQEDIVHALSCDGRTKVLKFDDSDPLQSPISAKSNYYRTTTNLSSSKSRHSGRQLVKPLSSSCICLQPYNPDRHIMHRCSGCERWYHISCIFEAHAPPEDIDWADNSGSMHDERSSGETSTRNEQTLPAFADIGDTDPKTVALALAKCPVTRGMEYGVVGTFSGISAARTMVQRVKSDPEYIFPEDWSALLEVNYFDFDLLVRESWYDCPNCHQPI